MCNYPLEICGSGFEFLPLMIMDGNVFGEVLQLVNFGESHGPVIGGVLLGFPAGFPLNVEDVQNALNRRRPGQSAYTTPRDESDRIEILSGIFEGKTLGTPIAFIIRNKNVRSGDYEPLRFVFRPSHADYTWEQKFGFRDYRGGGRSSARETAVRVAAGTMVKQMLKHFGIRIRAYTHAIGPVSCTLDPMEAIAQMQDENEVRCPDEEAAQAMKLAIIQAGNEGDSLGGEVVCVMDGLPAGLGEPVFQKFNAMLAGAMSSINAVKAVEIGMGFSGVRKRGSEMNDVFVMRDGKVETLSNHSGGIQGGITNGMPVLCKVGFKPVSSIRIRQETVDKDGDKTELEIHGRHDPCVVPRAVPIVEAMGALVAGDFLMRQGMIPRSWEKI